MAARLACWPLLSRPRVLSHPSKVYHPRMVEYSENPKRPPTLSRGVRCIPHPHGVPHRVIVVKKHIVIKNPNYHHRGCGKHCFLWRDHFPMKEGTRKRSRPIRAPTPSSVSTCCASRTHAKVEVNSLFFLRFLTRGALHYH